MIQPSSFLMSAFLLVVTAARAEPPAVCDPDRLRLATAGADGYQPRADGAFCEGTFGDPKTTGETSLLSVMFGEMPSSTALPWQIHPPAGGASLHFRASTGGQRRSDGTGADYYQMDRILSGGEPVLWKTDMVESLNLDTTSLGVLAMVAGAGSTFLPVAVTLQGQPAPSGDVHVVVTSNSRVRALGWWLAPGACGAGGVDAAVAHGMAPSPYGGAYAAGAPIRLDLRPPASGRHCLYVEASEYSSLRDQPNKSWTIIFP